MLFFGLEVPLDSLIFVLTCSQLLCASSLCLVSYPPKKKKKAPEFSKPRSVEHQ